MITIGGKLKNCNWTYSTLKNCNMFKLPLLLMVLLTLIATTRSMYANEEISSTLSDSLLAQEIVITDPDSKFFPDSIIQPIIKIKQFYGWPFPIYTSQHSDFNVGSSLTNLFNHHKSHGTVPRIAIRKKPFLYNRPFNFYSFEHFETIENIPDAQLIMLVGPPRSGKTLLLRYLYELKRHKEPNRLSIFIDLPHVLNDFHPSSYEHLTIHDILNNCVSDQLLDLVENLIDVNPSRVTLLFDGVDQVPASVLNKIINIINELLQKKTQVVTSSNSKIVKRLKVINIVGYLTVKIKSDISGENLREYMTEYWINKLASKNIQLDKQLVDDYYTAFEIIMRNSPLPRNIATMERFADYFSDRNIEKAVPDVSEYALKSNTQRPQLYEIILLAEKMDFPKMVFYDKYFENLTPHEVEYCGVIAVQLFCKINKFPIAEWQQRLNQVRKLIIDNSISPRIFMNEITDWKERAFMESTHDEYLYYFAAKEILANLFATNTPSLTLTFFEILADPNLRYVAEYIDKRVEYVPALANTHSSLWDGILQLSNDKSIHRILNNLLKNGFDSLCSKIFERIGLLRIEIYLSAREGSKLEPLKRGTVNRRIFGMLPLASIRNYNKDQNLVSKGYARRKPVFNLASKPSIILKNNMVKTHNVATKLGFDWPIENRLLNAAAQSQAALDLLVNKHFYQLQNNPKTVALVGWKLVVKYGPKSVDLLRSLNRVGGPSVLGAHIKDGRTLVHAAVQWADRDFLRVIHEEFSLPLIDTPDGMGRTILLTALDSSPFLMWTPDGFWPMMEYLIQQGDLISANQEQIKSIISYDTNIASPNTISIPSAYVALMTGSGKSDEDIRIARAIFQCVPLHEWDISAACRYGHRNAVIKHASLYLSPELYPDDYVTVSEIIIKHRGLDALSERSQLAYENAIFEIIKKEMNDFKPNQMLRIFTNILENVQTHSELMRIKTMYVNDIYPNIPQSWYFEPSYHRKIDELFHLRGQNKIIPNELPPNTPEIWGIKTRMDENPILIDDHNSNLQPDVDSNNIEITIEWIQACVDNFLTF